MLSKLSPLKIQILAPLKKIEYSKVMLVRVELNSRRSFWYIVQDLP